MAKKYKNPKVNARQSKEERKAKYQYARMIGWSVIASRRLRDFPYELSCTPFSCKMRCLS